jgi:glycosyltransferase involved in cell wall biosynthesis
MSKKLSIITINWNNADGLRKTMDSVVAQLTDDCEYIVVDGESEDGSPGVVETYRNYLAHWVSEPNAGIYGNMNKGIVRAQGDYCLFLNSGDWLADDVLARVIRECTGEDVIYFNTYLHYGEDRPTEELSYPPDLTMRSFFKRTIGHQSTLIRRELFERYGLYNENNRIHSDYEFWIRAIIAEDCTCRYVSIPLAYYDMGGRSSRPNPQTAQEIASIQARYLPRRILADYDYWYRQERDMEVLLWYRRHKVLNGLLVFVYKVIKNLSRLSGKSAKKNLPVIPTPREPKVTPQIG